MLFIECVSACLFAIAHNSNAINKCTEQISAQVLKGLLIWTSTRMLSSISFHGYVSNACCSCAASWSYAGIRGLRKILFQAKVSVPIAFG